MLANKVIPAPKNAPRTLLDLYRHYSGDEYATEEQVRAAWEKHATPLRRQIVSLALKGYNEYQIARGLSVSRDVVKRQLERACEVASKQIHGKAGRGKVSAAKARVLALMA